MTASICDILTWIGGAAAWFASNLGAPILTGVVAGLAVPFALRWESSWSEVRRHNREALDLNEEFRRFVSDLSRKVERHFRTFGGEQGMWKFKSEALARWESRELPVEDRLQRVADEARWRNEAEEIMQDALWRYRDEAIRKRQQFIELADAESKRHERRRRRIKQFPVLRLPEEGRRAVASWRKRPNPFGDEPAHLEAQIDLTAAEPTLGIFETEEGFTWPAAKNAAVGSTA